MFHTCIDYDKSKLYNQVSVSVGSTSIGEVLSTVDDVDCEEFYKKYLHDFVRLAHNCTHRNKEDEDQECEVSIALYSVPR